MKLDRIATICCTLGALFVLVALSLQYIILPRLPATASWSEQDAEVWMNSSKDYHNKSFDRKVTQQELEEAAQVFREQNEKLNSAKSTRANLPKYFQYSGYLLIAVGAGCYLYQKSIADD